MIYKFLHIDSTCTSSTTDKVWGLFAVCLWQWESGFCWAKVSKKQKRSQALFGYVLVLCCYRVYKWIIIRTCISKGLLCSINYVLSLCYLAFTVLFSMELLSWILYFCCSLFPFQLVCCRSLYHLNTIIRKILICTRHIKIPYILIPNVIASL